MKLAIIGLSNSGKTTVFNALTRQNLETTIYPTVTGEPNYGTVKVPDQRIDRLAEVFKPKKVTYATVEYIDYIGLTKGDMAQNRKVFDLIKDVDAIVHVVRDFKDDAVSHPLNDVNPLRDIETLEMELVFGDLEFVEKRLERIEEAARKGKKPNEAEKKLLVKCKEILEKEIPLRNARFSEEEEKLMRPLQFISTKPEVIVINTGEEDLNSDRSRALQQEVERYVNDKGIGETTKVVTLCGKIEMEIAQLSAEEAAAFLEDLGIGEPALNRLIHLSYRLLGLISFLTCGEDEVRAWTITQGTTAQKAAGKIHSDIERGFIRAEVVHYDDFIASGSMSAARDKGLFRLEGKTYEVKDGDIINFRFNV
ncbi:MAG: redox-regulated ATPase YchF [Alphaproteobacteria bacterium]|uniref:Ribosome-binding ATPase YchF n=1 Tax=Candidatus Nitrobium versatile TaxID=2884831 RepID=A0A953JDK7_9BACT|nr:redox-regulated ATPase YchF [Candidatus Nitrobium versatile]